MAEIGRRNLLTVVREAPPGLYLDGGGLGEVLLPRRYIPKNRTPASVLDVFIYLDSEDRLVATTETPSVMVGEFGYLKVVSVNRRVGAFLDWGLSKDLLLPFVEQARPVRAGERVVAAVYLDSQTERIVASTRLRRHFSREWPNYRSGQPAEFLISRETPLGYEGIVDNQHFGLLFRNNLTVLPRTGDQLKAFVRAVRPDGKIDLSVDPAGYKRVASVQLQILQALQTNGGRLPFDDDTPPEEIRRRYGVSKKAWKQALGALYKDRRIEFRNPGIELFGTEL